MRKNETGVNYLGRIQSIKNKRFVVQSVSPSVEQSYLEKSLSYLLQIKEGTVFAVEHVTDYGVRGLLDQLTQEGFVNRYGEGYIFCDYPRIHYAGIIFLLNGEISESQRAWGYTLPHESSEISLFKALFEALERHATYYSPSIRTVEYPIFKKGDASFLYDLIPHFSKEQLKKFPFLVGSANHLKNVLGFHSKSLLTGGKSFLPVSVFYYGKDLITDEIPALFDPTSSGSGAGQTLESATLSALYEMIERDHFLLYWFSGITPEEIVYDSVISPLGVYVTNMRVRYNLEVRFFNVGYDYSVKAVFCVVIDPVLNIIACGAKVGQNAEIVMEGALLEAIAVLGSLRGRDERGDFQSLKKILDGDTILDETLDRKKRVNMYCSAEGIALVRSKWLDKKHPRIDFEYFSKESIVFTSKKEELAYMIKNCKELFNKNGEGYNVFIHEHSSKYVKKIGCRVVHVFIPALLKLHLSEPMATPLSMRLVIFAQSKGAKCLSGEEISLFSLPHFFP